MSQIVGVVARGEGIDFQADARATGITSSAVGARSDVRTAWRLRLGSLSQEAAPQEGEQGDQDKGNRNAIAKATHDSGPRLTNDVAVHSISENRRFGTRVWSFVPFDNGK